MLISHVNSFLRDEDNTYALLKISSRKLTNNWNISIIEEKRPKKNFFTWKAIIKVNLIKQKFFFRTDILSKTGALMKLTKKLVTIPSSLWTRYLIKIIYIQTFALKWLPPPPHACIHSHLLYICWTASLCPQPLWT